MPESSPMSGSVARSPSRPWSITSAKRSREPDGGPDSANPALREWHTDRLDRLPGLKFMRTLWVCDVTGGPQQYAATRPGSTPLGLEAAHRELKISPAEFDEVAAEPGARSTSSGYPSERRTRSWPRSPHTKAR